MGGTFSLSYTRTLPRVWYKPWTWRKRTIVVSTGLIPYGAPSAVVEREIAEIARMSTYDLAVEVLRESGYLVTFGGTKGR